MPNDVEIGRHLAMSSRAVGEWRSRGILPAKGGSLDENRKRYLRHLRETAAARVKTGEISTLDVERSRLAKEQADAIARQNAIARCELVPARPMGDAVRGMIAAAKAALGRVGAAVSPDNAELRQRINGAVAAALQDLSAERVLPLDGAD